MRAAFTGLRPAGQQGQTRTWFGSFSTAASLAACASADTTLRGGRPYVSRRRLAQYADVVARDPMQGDSRGVQTDVGSSEQAASDARAGVLIAWRSTYGTSSRSAQGEPRTALSSGFGLSSRNRGGAAAGGRVPTAMWSVDGTRCTSCGARIEPLFDPSLQASARSGSGLAASRALHEYGV